MNTKIVSFLFLVVLLSACGSNVHLDNPRNESATLTIDGTAYELGAGESQWINLEPGRHDLQVNAGEFQIDTTFRLKESGLVHSGGSNYVIWRRLYGLQKDRETLLNEDWMELDSTKLFGDFKVFPTSMVYIEQNWDYGLEEELPEAVKLYSTSDFKVNSKVFREKGLVATYRKLSRKAK